jgi:hypothetical protein
VLENSASFQISIQAVKEKITVNNSDMNLYSTSVDFGLKTINFYNENPGNIDPNAIAETMFNQTLLKNIYT